MGILDALTGNAGRQAAASNRGEYEMFQNNAMAALSGGYSDARDTLQETRDVYSPLAALASKYGGATTLGLGALGVNGAGGQADARAAFQAGPAYNFNLEQGLEAINRRRAMGGMLNSGNADRDAQEYGSGLASREYEGWLSKLLGFTSPELAATGARAGGLAGLGLAEAGLSTDLAKQRVGVYGTKAGGIAGANTAEAKASTDASANVINLGIQAAKLAAGAYGGYGGGGGLGGGGLDMASKPGGF